MELLGLFRILSQILYMNELKFFQHVRIMLWIEEYDPVVNPLTRALFTKYSKFETQLDSNMFIYGCRNTGKKSWVQIWVEKMFDVGEWVYEEFVLKLERKCNIEIYTRYSNNHVEVYMKDYGTMEKYIMRFIIKKMCSHHVIGNNGRLSKKHIIIYNVHFFSQESIIILTKFIELYNSCSIFTLISSKHIQKLDSYVPTIRFTTYGIDEISNIVKLICEDKACTYNNTVMDDIYISKEADVVDCLYHYQLFVTKSQDKLQNSFYNLVSAIQNTNVAKSREYVYELLVNNIESSSIIKKIVQILLTKIQSDDHKHGLIRYASIFEHRLVNCERHVYHIEAFIIHVMYMIST